MRIQELKLIRYGKFTDRHVSLPAHKQDIHLIVGPNEAGKSTVRAAIGDWLFGIPVRTPLAFLHPMPELRVGGVLERIAAGASATQLLAFDRTKGNKNTLRTPQGAVLPDSELQPWLSGVQVQAFQRMYALDHATLVEGGAGILSASDDIGRLLFQSAAGIEHLGDVLEQLQAEADALWGPRKSGARAYYQALETYENAQAQFKQSTLRTKDWKAQHDGLVATEQALAAARQRDAALRQQLGRLERIRRVRPMLLALDAAQLQYREMLAEGETPLLPEDAAGVLSEARQAMVLIQADVQRLQHETAQAQALLDGTPVDAPLLSLAAEITELNERRLQFRAHRTDMLKRAEEIRQLWLRVQEIAGGLDWPADSEDLVRQRLPAAPVRARLARLLKERASVVQQQRSSQSQLAERQQQVQQAQQLLAGLATSTANPALVAAVEQALKLGDHAAALREGQQKIAHLASALEAALAGLGAWRVAPAALAAMVVPAAAQIQSLVEHCRSDAAQLQSLQETLHSKTQLLQALALELQQLVQNFQPISREQVQQARQVRDGEWQAIKNAPQALSERARHFEKRVVEADDLADARLDRAQYDADRRAKEQRMEQHRLEVQMLQANLEGVRARISDRLAQWQSESSACGLPQLPLEMAPVWLEQRQRALDMGDGLVQAELQHQGFQHVVAQLQNALWAVLAPDAAQQQPPELAECVQRARAVLAQAEQVRGQRQALEQRIREEQASLVRLQEERGVAQANLATWEGAWQAAVVLAGYGPTAPTEQVETELAAMQEIEQLLGKIRSIRSERIDLMQADLDGLAASSEALAQRIAPEWIGHPAQDVALELARRLETAKQAEAAALEQQLRLARSRNELQAARQRQLAVQARLAPLMAAAGVDELEALARAIARSDLRRAVEEKMATAATVLAQASDGVSVVDLRRDVAGIGPDALQAEQEHLGRLSGEVVDEIAQLSHQHGVQKSAFAAFDGADIAAKAEARRQEAVAAMAEAAERYLALHTASRLLQWAMEKFRETRQGPMLAKASSLFNALTLGSFSRLLVDSDGQTPRLFGVRADGAQVDVAGMSEGSRDQLYLALRLAALELQVDQGLNLPLIADDLFINFDDRRTAAGLAVLGQLSRKMQVVFLTHHDHLVPLAQEVLGADLNVVAL